MNYKKLKNKNPLLPSLCAKKYLSKKSKLGYTLFEIIVIILFFSFIFFSLIFLSALSLRQSLLQTNIYIASHLAVEKIEELKKKDFKELKSGSELSIYGYPEFQRYWIIEDNVPKPYMKKITVIVVWKRKESNPLRIEIMTYKNIY